MRHLTRAPWLALLVAFVLVPLLDRPAGAIGRIEIDEPFPDLLFPSAEDGRPRSLKEFRGQKVFLQVFASW